MTECDFDMFLIVRKLVMIFMMEVFKDIILGYRIRLLIEVEKVVKVENIMIENELLCYIFF